MDEHLQRQGIGEALRYYNVFSRYKPLVDRAKAEYDASPEIQGKVKVEFERLKTLAETEFKDSPALMQLLATMPSIINEIKAAHD